MKRDGWKLYCEALRALFPSPTVKPDDIVSPAALQEMVDRLSALPAGTVAVPYAMVDDALTLLEGWIGRYCKPRFKEEHLRNLEQKRAALAAARRGETVQAAPTSKSDADALLHWAGCYGLLSEILGKGALSHHGDADLIDRVKLACQDFEARGSKS